MSRRNEIALTPFDTTSHVNSRATSSNFQHSFQMVIFDAEISLRIFYFF